jgi:hypothetical protein
VCTGSSPQPDHLVVELEQRDRGAGHLERRDVVADEGPGDLDAPAGEDLVDPAVDDVQLDERRPAHAVDEREHSVPLSEDTFVQDRGHEHVDDLVGRCDGHAPASRLAVDADPDLHLVATDLEGRCPGGWNDAARQLHAHGADVVLHPLAERLDRLKIRALLGGGPDDLLREHRPTDAAPPCGMQRILRDVIGDDDRFDADPSACASSAASSITSPV